MLEQNDARLQPIAQWGCYFCSLGKIAEDVSGRELTVEQIMSAYSESVTVSVMGWNCYIKNPARVLYFFLAELGLDSARVDYVGWWNKDQHRSAPEMFGGWRRGAETHEVLRYKSGVGHHFRLAGYDPWPELNVKEITGRRLLRVELDVAA